MPFVEYVPLVPLLLFSIIELVVVELFELLYCVLDGLVAFTELVLSVVTGDVYVGFVVVLVVEYVLVVVCALAMPKPNRQIASSVR